MATDKTHSRFFESTRGKLVLLLRTGEKTVNELSAEMELTDNAVRAHLTALERDGLVTTSGTVKGFRKPHYVYTLTAEARHLFPSAYDSLLNKLLSVLKKSFSPRLLLQDLRRTGRGIAQDAPLPRAHNAAERLQNAVAAIKELGGSARVVNRDNEVRIESEGCPFADVVIEHPEICKVTESIIAEITGEKVAEICDRSGPPKCRFRIKTVAGPA